MRGRPLLLFSVGAAFSAIAAGIALFFTAHDKAPLWVAIAAAVLLAIGTWVTLVISFREGRREEEK